MTMRIFPDYTGFLNFTSGAVRISLHTGDPSVADIESDESMTLVPGANYTRARIAEHEQSMSGISWTTASAVVTDWGYGATRTSWDDDPYELRHDPTPSGIGDPLAEVRGLSYDDTLRAIDEALRG